MRGNMMFSRIRRRFSYANVVVTLALVFAMTGGAYAANKYLITSTKQISPKVLKALKGASGTSGTAGPAGTAGAMGAAGPQGPQGIAGAKGETGATGAVGAKGENGVPGVKGEKGTTGFTETLPSGKTLKGEWGLSVVTPEKVTFELPVSANSFGIPLKEAPTAHYINTSEKELTPTGEQQSTACLGKVAEPTATPGNLCVYAMVEIGLSENEPDNNTFLKWKWGIAVTDLAGSGAPNTDSSFGFGVHAFSLEGAGTSANGSWAVTAP
jgi:hypothetical protein